MSSTPIDYDALAAQARGGASGQEIDYDALAAQARAHPGALATAGNALRDFGEGIGAGVVSTGVGAYNLARKFGPTRAPTMPEIVAGAHERPPLLPPVREDIQAATQPPDYSGLGWPGKAGKVAEQVGEFMAPSGIIGKGAKAIEGATAGMRAAPVLNATGKAALEASSAAGVTAAQTGGDTTAMRNAALTAGGVSAAMPPVVRGVGAAARAVLGKTTGAGEEAIRTAATAPTAGFMDALRGNVDEGDIVGGFRSALQKVKDARGDAYRQQLAALPQQQLPPSVLDPVRQALLQKLQAFRVQVSPTGDLDFSHSVIPKAEEGTVKSIAGDIGNWSDLTPLGLDALKRRIGNYYSPTSDVRALTSTVANATKKTLTANVPGYADMTQGYANATDFITKLEQEMALGPKSQQGTTIRRISYALKQNNEYRQMLTEALDQFANTDLKEQLAGYHLKDTLPKGLMGVGSGVGVLTAIATGNLTPVAATALILSSPRLVGETLAAMSKLQGAPAALAASAAPKAAAAFTVNRDQPQPQFAKGGIVTPKKSPFRRSKRGILYGPRSMMPPEPAVAQKSMPPEPHKPAPNHPWRNAPRFGKI